VDGTSDGLQHALSWTAPVNGLQHALSVMQLQARARTPAWFFLQGGTM
jgi:hypothetical protein